MESKVTTREKIISCFKDGQTIAIGGQTGHWMPERLIDCILESGARHLTVYSIDTSDPGVGIGRLIRAKVIDRIITTHVGTNPDTNAQIQAGTLQAEFSPIGSWIERIRCGGMGLGGVLTKTGLGTVVEEGECVFIAKAEGGSNRYDKIVAMIEESEKLKSSTENRALALADRLVPWCLGATVVTYALTRNATRAISCLMVDFSCALKLSMPLAVLSAMRECGASHITVKGGKYLETLSKADTIVFDKTGTLTRATPKVVKVVPFSGCSESEVLQLAACLEEHFPHSMANAVVREAKERGISHQEMHSEVEYIVAHGIASRVSGERVVIGSHHFVFEDEHCTIPEDEREKFDGLEPEYSHLYLAASGHLAGVICIADPLRPEASRVLRALRGLGITNTVMMTGDSERTAAAIAKQVGVDQFFAEVLPEDKAAFVQKAKSEGHTVVMIGDGINDSPALSAADVGIAINSGAAIAREIADVTIKADSLEELVILKTIANSLQRRVSANYRFVLTFNSALIALGAMGILQPASSAMLHNLSTIGISLKSMTNLIPEEKAQKALAEKN